MVLRVSLILCAALYLAGCDSFRAWFAREFRQETIADGVARLSTRHISMIVSELNKKFESNEAQIVVNKEHGEKSFGRGEVIWRVKDVVINYPEETTVYADCLSENTKWQGKAYIISASRTMKGRLTHNKENPVIPDPQTLSIEVHARLDNLLIRASGAENYLLIESGEVIFKAYPRLAQSQKGNLHGLRIVPTSNIRFEEVQFLRVRAKLFSSEINMPITIDESHLTMQAGKGETGDENRIFGRINIFGQEHVVPSDGQGLDPEYNQIDFEKRFLCHEQLAGFVSYEHVAFETKMARPVALLNTLLAGAVVEQLESNKSCGMANPDVVRNAVITGRPGEDGRVLTDAHSPCFVHFNNYQTKPDCFGKAYIIHGTAQVMQAQKSLRGLIITNQEMYNEASESYATAVRHHRSSVRPEPVVPSSSTGASFSAHMKFHGLSVRPVCLREHTTTHQKHCTNQKVEEDFSYTIYKGEAEAYFQPQLAKQLDKNDAQYGFCSVQSPSGQFTLSIKGLEASLKRERHDIHVYAEGDYELIQGRVLGRENQLVGELTINDVHVPFKEKDHDYVALDPDYDRQDFLSSFMSCSMTKLVDNDDECRAEHGLAPNVARLLTLSAGSLIKVASAKEISGSFSSRYAVNNRRLLNDEQSLVLPARSEQEIDLAETQFLSMVTSIDGLGARLKIDGKVMRFEGELHRDGVRINSPIRVVGYNVNPSSNRYVEALSSYWYDRQEIFVRPIVPMSTIISLTAHMNSFRVRFYKPGHANAEPHLVIKSGEISLRARPVFGLDDRTQNQENPSYSIPTPIIKFDAIEVRNAQVILNGVGLKIPLVIPRAQLRAFNGRHAGEGNYLEGDIDLYASYDGSADAPDSYPRVRIERIKLNSSFEQAAFNQSYANTPHLYTIVPSD